MVFIHFPHPSIVLHAPLNHFAQSPILQNFYSKIAMAIPLFNYGITAYMSKNLHIHSHLIPKSTPSAILAPPLAIGDEITEKLLWKHNLFLEYALSPEPAPVLHGNLQVALQFIQSMMFAVGILSTPGDVCGCRSSSNQKSLATKLPSTRRDVALCRLNYCTRDPGELFA